MTKPHLRLKGRIWSCSVCDGNRVVEIGYGYTPWTAWMDLQSRLYDLEVK